MLWPKINSYKEFDNKKKTWGSKIPLPPPITFLMVRPLVLFYDYQIENRFSKDF